MSFAFPLVTVKKNSMGMFCRQTFIFILYSLLEEILDQKRGITEQIPLPISTTRGWAGSW